MYAGEEEVEKSFWLLTLNRCMMRSMMGTEQVRARGNEKGVCMGDRFSDEHLFFVSGNSFKNEGERGGGRRGEKTT